MINLEVLDNILALDDDILYLAIMDSRGNIIANRVKEGTTNEYEQELLRIDLYIVKQMLDLYDNSFGKTISMQTRREKLSQLVFYHDYMIIYVACEPNILQSKMNTISEMVTPLVKEIVRKT